MLKNYLYKALLLLLSALAISCSEEVALQQSLTQEDFATLYPEFYKAFSETIDFNNLDYSSQAPVYITRDNTANNPVTQSGALLGRVLFYDKQLSTDQSVSCASCHQQEHAFGDPAAVSIGVNGLTARHSMRLINSRFSSEDNFFWDERAGDLEAQSTQPIRDHNEMGFSGLSEGTDFEDLIERLSQIDYYSDLFLYTFGSADITEDRIQLALAQFVRSIESFDSRYDEGRRQAQSDQSLFVNFSADENAGKSLFLLSRNQGGANCASCHQPPEFSIRQDSLNNGVIGVFGSVSELDLDATRSPSIRDLVTPSGASNGPFMHDASSNTLEDIVEHYDSGIIDNSNLDRRLDDGRSLNLTSNEKAQLVLFLKTLSGNDVYTNSKWSDPFGTD